MSQQTVDMPAGEEQITLIPLKGMRGSIARNMTAGWQAPRVAMAVDVDLTAVTKKLVAMNATAGSGSKVTVTAFVLHALAKALRMHPALNALVKDGVVERIPSIHLGLAVSIDDGLAVPVIRDAHLLTVNQLADASRELAGGARSGKLPPKSYQGGTVTLTNLGSTGIDWFTPILNPPQVSIVGLSAVTERPVVRDGSIVVATMTTLTLVFDHRAVDGYPAAQFLACIKKILEEADAL
jgi:pyruvate/2-oxoglutarate dehydrogenase complex dihydrolipoamide acyltransferase (E2) component